MSTHAAMKAPRRKFTLDAASSVPWRPDPEECGVDQEKEKFQGAMGLAETVYARKIESPY
jgi:hypothetical protein